MTREELLELINKEGINSVLKRALGEFPLTTQEILVIYWDTKQTKK